MQMSSTLADAVEQRLLRRWNCKPFVEDNSLREHVPMRLISLPKMFVDKGISAVQLQNWLYSVNVEAPIKDIDGELFVRLSFAVYNTPDHYLAFENAIDQAMFELEQ